MKSAYRSHTYQLQFEGELNAVNDFEIISQEENNAVFKALNGKTAITCYSNYSLKLKLSLSKRNYQASTISSSKSQRIMKYLTHHTKRYLSRVRKELLDNDAPSFLMAGIVVVPTYCHELEEERNIAF